MRSSHFKVAIIGEVDSGKSTTLGQILIQTQSVMPSKMLDVLKASELQNKDFEPAFLLDSFEIERSQEMTVDITTTNCKMGNLTISFLDTPGHQHLSSKFIGGAADVDMAILILDAQFEPNESQFRHLQMLRKVGLHKFAVLVNKLDANQPEAHFRNYTEKIKTLIFPFENEILYMAPVDSKKGLGFSRSDYGWFLEKNLFDFIKSQANIPNKISFLFCMYWKNTNETYWLSCHSGKITTMGPLHVGNLKINSVSSLNSMPFDSKESPWLKLGVIETNEPIPENGFICESQDSSRFVDRFQSDLVEFEEIENQEYLIRNFWSTGLCKVSKDPDSKLFTIELEKPLQVYNLEIRYNLFSIWKGEKTMAVGIPRE